MDDKLLEVSVVARRLTVSERTVYRMLADPACPLKAIRIYRGGIRIFADSVKAILDQQQDNFANPDNS